MANDIRPDCHTQVGIQKCKLLPPNHRFEVSSMKAMARGPQNGQQNAWGCKKKGMKAIS
jgi:hypothetical protein